MTEPSPDPAAAKPRKAQVRRENRVAAMQFLYMCQANPPDTLEESIHLFFENREKPREYFAFAEELAWEAWPRREELDVAIQTHLQNWSFSRIARVDLAILRLAAYELLFRRDIPPIVSINEAIDISKEFSSPNSKRFINGILDKLSATLDRPLRTAAE